MLSAERKMDVRLCRGCLACEEGGRERKGICKIKDDMTDVYPKLLAADAFVLATLATSRCLSGLLKNSWTAPVLSGRGWKASAWPSGRGRGRRGAGNRQFPDLRGPLQDALDGQRHGPGEDAKEAAANKGLGAALRRLARKLVFPDSGVGRGSALQIKPNLPPPRCIDNDILIVLR